MAHALAEGSLPPYAAFQQIAQRMMGLPSIQERNVDHGAELLEATGVNIAGSGDHRRSRAGFGRPCLCRAPD